MSPYVSVKKKSTMDRPPIWSPMTYQA